MGAPSASVAVDGISPPSGPPQHMGRHQEPAKRVESPLWAVLALRPDTRARAFGVAQSGLYAVPGLGILAGGAVAQLIGAPLAVGLASLVGLTAATMLATSWTHLRGRLIQARPNGPESPLAPAATSAAC